MKSRNFAVIDRLDTKTEMRLFRLQRHIGKGCGVGLLSVVMLSACTTSSDTVSMGDERPMAVNFSTYVLRSEPTRAAAFYPAEGAMTNEKLRDTGFGVFAHHSGYADYNRQEAFNFMFNQQVTWNESSPEAWVYSPVKYWPNENQPADFDGAQGLHEHSYLHFFAYAPYQTMTAGQLASGYAATGDAYGITAISSNSSTDAHLHYKSYLEEPGRGVDLLWAKQDYLYKTMTTGEGFVDGRVAFLFQHALAKLNIVVQGLFDHATLTDQPVDGYGSERNGNTRILIEQVTLSDVPQDGDLFLAPKLGDNTYDHTAVKPCWEIDTPTGTANVVNTTPTLMNGDLKMYLPVGSQPTDDDVSTVDKAKDWLESLPVGVDETERPLFKDDERTDLCYLLPPGKGSDKAKPLTVRMVYYVITYDPRLVLNEKKYFSIVRNDITATFEKNLELESGKYYTLRLLPGLTSVKFEVVDVTDADVPIVLDAVVKEWDVETHEYNVE